MNPETGQATLMHQEFTQTTNAAWSSKQMAKVIRMKVEKRELFQRLFEEKQKEKSNVQRSETSHQHELFNHDGVVAPIPHTSAYDFLQLHDCKLPMLRSSSHSPPTFHPPLQSLSPHFPSRTAKLNSSSTPPTNKLEVSAPDYYTAPSQQSPPGQSPHSRQSPEHSPQLSPFGSFNQRSNSFLSIPGVLHAHSPSKSQRHVHYEDDVGNEAEDEKEDQELEDEHEEEFVADEDDDESSSSSDAESQQPNVSVPQSPFLSHSPSQSVSRSRQHHTTDADEAGHSDIASLMSTNTGFYVYDSDHHGREDDTETAGSEGQDDEYEIKYTHRLRTISEIMETNALSNVTSALGASQLSSFPPSSATSLLASPTSISSPFILSPSGSTESLLSLLANSSTTRISSNCTTSSNT